ncbi:MAG: serine/threonine protein kinase [Deltaproteobacteria bacterium]|nr:serine/threonine protein kinase [Deltaproteobacteria bacterium]
MAPETQREPQTPPRGQYYLMEKIAQGGMAEIFKGLSYDIHGLKRTVCIKKILPHIAASREFIDSLIDEAKIAVTLSHGNIAHTYDLGKVGDDYFIVMEYVEGKSISHIAKRAKTIGKPIPVPVACYLIAEVANGLDYIHRRTDESGTPLNIVHRDISPQNIVVSYAGTLKIIDFGIAIAAGRLGMTEVGILKGKFSYMSPEQARGETLDHRSDIFSLGVIMYELLTGTRLFKAEDNRETLRNVRRARVTAPSLLRSELPDDIDRITLRALQRDRRHRFPSATLFRDQLVKFLHTAYPDFQTTDVAHYVRELFRDELAEPKIDEDAKTPHLIIDATHSALTGDRDAEPTHHAVAPVDLKEFLIEEPEEKSEPPPPEPVKDDLEEDEKTTSHARRRWWGGLAIGAIIGAGIAMFALRLREVPIAPPEPSPPPPVAIPEAPPPEKQEEPPRVITSTVTLDSTPSGAVVYVDGEQTSWKTPATIRDLKPGTHRLGLFVDNYRFWEKEVNLTGDETRHFDIQLTKDFASLVITTQPPGALVIVGGVPVGQTPFERRDVEPGQVVRVEIWLEGYRHVTREVMTRAGRAEEVRLTLEPQRQEGETK